MTFINNTFDTVDDEELAAALALKSDKNETYTKQQVNNNFQPTGDYATNTNLGTKADKPPTGEDFAFVSAVNTKQVLPDDI